jgi:hypothetical protein
MRRLIWIPPCFRPTIWSRFLAFLFKGAVIEANPSIISVLFLFPLSQSWFDPIDAAVDRTSQARSTEGDRLGLLSLCTSRPPKSHALTRSVLVNEFDSCRLESSSYSRFVGGRDRNLSIEDLDPTDRGNTDFRL